MENKQSTARQIRGCKYYKTQQQDKDGFNGVNVSMYYLHKHRLLLTDMFLLKGEMSQFYCCKALNHRNKLFTWWSGWVSSSLVDYPLMSTAIYLWLVE